MLNFKWILDTLFAKNQTTWQLRKGVKFFILKMFYIYAHKFFLNQN